MTLYEILGIDKDATFPQVKAAHRKTIAKYHPDRVSGMQNKFQEAQQAYEVLIDQDRRERYDRTGRMDDVKVTPAVIASMIDTILTGVVNIERPDGTTDDPTWENIQRKILDTVVNGRRECVANLKRQRKKLDRLENIAKRFKSKTEQDPIGDAFAAQRIKMTAELHKLQDGLELSIKTEEVFRSYDYEMGEVGTKPEGQFSPAPTRRLSGPVYASSST